MVVWMDTNALSRKVGEIRKDPRVTVSCFDPDSMGYATLLGRATLVSDPAESEGVRNDPKTWRAAGHLPECDTIAE